MVQPIYRDIDQTLKRNSLKDGDAVFQAIVNVLKTRKGTRMFNMEFGSNLEDIIMEPCDELTALQVYAEVVDAVTRWEPRAILDRGKTKVTPDPDHHIFWVDLWFSVKGIDGQEFNYEVGLKR